MAKAKAKPKVEYRWFMWSPTTELLGGVVAQDAQTAFYGLSGEEREAMRGLRGNHNYELVRVRLEYVKPKRPTVRR
jgi:hypothetical protein